RYAGLGFRATRDCWCHSLSGSFRLFATRRSPVRSRSRPPCFQQITPHSSQPEVAQSGSRVRSFPPIPTEILDQSAASHTALKLFRRMSGPEVLENVWAIRLLKMRLAEALG